MGIKVIQVSTGLLVEPWLSARLLNVFLKKDFKKQKETKHETKYHPKNPTQKQTKPLPPPLTQQKKKRQKCKMSERARLA